MQKFYSFASIVFFGFLLWIIYSADAGHGNVFFSWVKTIRNGDKYGHFFLFGFLTLLLNGALNRRVIGVKYFKIYLGTLLVSTFVVLEELSQAFFPRRTLDAKDLLADALGILVFSLIGYFLGRFKFLNKTQ